MHTRSIPNGKQVSRLTEHSPVFYHARCAGKAFYTLRANRTIVAAGSKPLHGVHELFGRTYIVTRRVSAEASRVGRIRLKVYRGHFPRLALLWAELKDSVKEVLGRG